MTKDLRFLVKRPQDDIEGNLRDVFFLVTDNWDDFGHKVQFHLNYIDFNGVESKIGTLKILQRSSLDAAHMQVMERTSLPKSFEELSEDFISLGQEERYYKNLRKFHRDRVDEVLVALRDISWQPALALDFETTTAFRNALMRENIAQRSRRFGRAWALGESIQEQFSFAYSCNIEGADDSIDVSIDLGPSDQLPGRIVGIIGRNAAGKTRFLAKLGEDLAQISRASAESLARREERFPNGRPLFTRVIAISYSAFDRFRRPPQNSTSSYVYCGIRNEKGALSKTSLLEAYKKNQDRIRQRGIEGKWTRHMQMILGDDGRALTERLDAEIFSPSQDDNTLSLLSSGQSILCHFVTALLAWIQPNTLVLFDEPETHLHPNAVASLFLVLTDILNDFDSYAIVATHSPVVIQEMPAKRVILFQRKGNVTTADQLELESFGESLTELTRHVFETIDVESLYRKTLRSLARNYSPEDAMAFFDNGLSLSAQAYLLAQYDKKKNK